MLRVVTKHELLTIPEYIHMSSRPAARSENILVLVVYKVGVQGHFHPRKMFEI